MPIYKIDNASYYGFRINAGGTHQRYVSLKLRTSNSRCGNRKATRLEEKSLFKKAQIIETRILKLQKLDAKNRHVLRHTDPEKRRQSPSLTRVCGITLRLKKSVRRNKTYIYPAFTVHVINSTPKSFYISQLGWTKAWEEAVIHLAKVKKIKRYDHLLSRKPRRTQLDRLIQHHNLDPDSVTFKSFKEKTARMPV